MGTAVMCSCHDCLGMEKVEVPEAVLAKLAKISTTTLWGLLNQAGIPNTFMAGVLPRTSKQQFAGTALTLRMLPPRADVAKAQQGRENPHRASFATVSKNQCVVIDARGDHDTGVLGDVFAASILVRGGAALVTDGAVRDLPAMEEVGLPIYTPSGHAGSAGMRHLPAELNVPIQCAGVLVLPGDVLVGDAQGVVVIPQAMAAEIADKAWEVELRDLFSRNKVMEGTPLEEAFPLGQGLQAEYQEWRKTQPNS
jgi:regulator of RNase E activity RraA